MTKNISISKIFILSIIILCLTAVSNPALAGDTIDFCSDAESTADTISTVFTIFSVLGPVFGSLFFIGMTVADTAKMSGDYKKERKRVLLYGFSVPVAIQFLYVVGSQLIEPDIYCFFPGASP